MAKDGDWKAIESLAREQHARTVFADFAFSDQKFAALAKQAKTPRTYQCLIVAEYQGCVAGLAWFSAGEYVLGDGGIITTTHLLAVDSNRLVFIKLLRGSAAWSRAQNAKQILVHVTTGTKIRQTDRLLRAGGAICIGGSYLIDECVQRGPR